MEHQVFVPVAVDDLRAVLRDPARVAGCVPGLQRDAGEAVSASEAGGGAGGTGVVGGLGGVGGGSFGGRLKVRVGNSTVTYRGVVSVVEAGDAGFVVVAEGAEVRGSGSVSVTLRVALRGGAEGTWLEFAGDAEVAGRAAEFAPEAADAAVRRLLDRVGSALGDEAAVAPGGGAEGESPSGAGPVPGAGAGVDPGAGAGGSASVFDAEVPPPSLDPALDPFLEDDFGTRVPAEAAHARRTMIGRSAEEVDHAPPRGRYAPVPAPEAGGAGGAMRWVAPAAALALAGAVVVARSLRRRRP
ncbi:SRPBCC domain-containing protein [Streptomyces sp. NPDC101132]|uniref:SRPBCC domain-containing protein n=1 Tax=Streptomyces sp. NPDC101132 TaxID=3366110 RepID=UPI00382D8DE1